MTTYGWVSKIALGNRLEESRLSDVGKADLESKAHQLGATGGRPRALGATTYNTALEVVAGAAEENLLLDDSLLGGHLGGSPLAIATELEVGESAVKHRRLKKSRASC